MGALAQELISANTALSAVQKSPAYLMNPRGDLLAAAGVLEYFARTLLGAVCSADHLRVVSSREYQNFAYLTLCASSGVILECCSLEEGCSPVQFVRHTHSVQQLLDALSAVARTGQPNPLNALRASACNPKTILSCVQRLFNKDWGGEEGEELGARINPAFPLTHSLPLQDS